MAELARPREALRAGASSASSLCWRVVAGARRPAGRGLDAAAWTERGAAVVGMTKLEPPRAAPLRSLDALVACPHCAGAVDVTVEVHRARIDMMALLWNAFLENGASIETALWDLEADLLERISEGTRSPAPIARFCARTSVPTREARAMARTILRLTRRRDQ